MLAIGSEIRYRIAAIFAAHWEEFVSSTRQFRSAGETFRGTLRHDGKSVPRGYPVLAVSPCNPARKAGGLQVHHNDQRGSDDIA